MKQDMLQEILSEQVFLHWYEEIIEQEYSSNIEFASVLVNKGLI